MHLLGTMLNHLDLTASVKNSDPFSGTNIGSGANDLICCDTAEPSAIQQPLVG
jgi:hypothetical protein